MNNQEFNIVLKESIEHVEKTLKSKGVEYTTSRGDDRLAHFKRAGEMLDCAPSKALLGMLAKHLTSIVEMVNSQDETGAGYCVDMWKEKIFDSISYLILLYALELEDLALSKSEG